LLAVIPIGSNPIDATLLPPGPHFTAIAPNRVASRSNRPAPLGGVIFCSTNSISLPFVLAKNTFAELARHRSVDGCNAPKAHIITVIAKSTIDTKADPSSNRLLWVFILAMIPHAQSETFPFPNCSRKLS
jgi:hypothetical protein